MTKQLNSLKNVRALLIDEQALESFKKVRESFARLDFSNSGSVLEKLKYAEGDIEISDQILAIVEKVGINAKIEARLAARKAKDWKESDRIRDELAAMGIQLKDGKDPATGEPTTTWDVKR